MANLHLLVIYDRKAQMFLKPIPTPSIGSVLRDLTTIVNGGEDMMAKYPQDFVLMKLGMFDDSNGQIESVGLPQEVMECSSLVDVPKGHVGNGAGGSVELKDGFFQPR